MSIHTKIEVAMGLVILFLVTVFATQYYKGKLALVEAQARSTGYAEGQKKADSDLAARNEEYKARVALLEKKNEALSKMTPTQIIEKAPEYIPLPKPIVIAGPSTTSVPIGSAIVPQEDVLPIAQGILNGKRCELDLSKCTADLRDFQTKFDLASKDAETWKKAAKGGSRWARVFSGMKWAAIGAAVGYAAARH